MFIAHKKCYCTTMCSSLFCGERETLNFILMKSLFILSLLLLLLSHPHFEGPIFHNISRILFFIKCEWNIRKTIELNLNWLLNKCGQQLYIHELHKSDPWRSCLEQTWVINPRAQAGQSNVFIPPDDLRDSLWRPWCRWLRRGHHSIVFLFASVTSILCVLLPLVWI